MYCQRMGMTVHVWSAMGVPVYVLSGHGSDSSCSVSRRA